jgi:hypothetical protein
MATPVLRQHPQDVTECAMMACCVAAHALIRGDAVRFESPDDWGGAGLDLYRVGLGRVDGFLRLWPLSGGDEVSV